MMYSSADIREAIADGSLHISPFHPRMVRPSGLTLHLGELLLRPLPGKVVDVKNKIIPDYEEVGITMQKPHELKPGEFVLGHTFEAVTVGQKLGFFIEGRSTLARVGLTIVQTAMLVYPGHSERSITLELANHGVNSILLYPKMKIARAAIFELKTPSEERYDDTGKYGEQGSVGRPVFADEFMQED